MPSKSRFCEVGHSDDATHQLDYRLDMAGWLDGWTVDINLTWSYDHMVIIVVRYGKMLEFVPIQGLNPVREMS